MEDGARSGVQRFAGRFADAALTAGDSVLRERRRRDTAGSCFWIQDEGGLLEGRGKRREKYNAETQSARRSAEKSGNRNQHRDTEVGAPFEGSG